MFDAGNLITLGVVLVIVIAYRLLDRDNRSLEKVKKYTDRLKDELDAMAADRAQALKAYAVEVDTHKKSAKEVLRQVQEAEQHLDARAEGISTMATRIGEYDKALSELKAMSLRVDENLKLIHQESHFADGLAKTLNHYKSELEKLSREIPAIREAAYQESLASSQNLAGQFASTLENANQKAATQAAAVQRELATAFDRAKKEAETLEADSFSQLKQQIDLRSKTLEQHLAGSLAQLEQNQNQALKTSQAESMASLQQLSESGAEARRQLEREIELKTAELLSALDRLDARLTETVEQRFGQIEAYASERGGKLEEIIETRFATVKEQLGARLGEVQLLVKTFRQDWRKEAEELLQEARSRSEELVGQLAPLIQKTENEFIQAQTRLTGRLQEHERGQLEALSLLDGKLEDIKTRSAGALQELERKLAAQEQKQAEQLDASAARIKEQEHKYQEQAQNLGMKFKEGLKAWQEELVKQQNDLKAGLKQELQQARTDAAEFKAELSAELAAAGTAMRDSLRQSGQEAAALAQTIENRLEQSHKQLEQAGSDQEKLAESFREGLKLAEAENRRILDALNDKFAERGADLETRVLAGFEQRSAALRALVEQGLERLEGSRLDVQELDKALRQGMLAVEHRIEADFSSFEQRMGTEASKLQHAMKALDEDLQTLKANAYENVSEHLKIFEDDFFADLRKRREDTDAKLQDWRSTLEDRLAAALHEADTARTEAERTWLEEARGKAATVQQRVGEALEKLATQVDAHRSAITERVTEAEAALVSLRASVKAELDEAKTGTDAWVQAELARWKQGHSENLQRIEQKTAAELIKLGEQVDQAGLAFDTGRQQLVNRLETLQAELGQKMEESSQNTRALLDKLQEQTAGLVTQLEKDWQVQSQKLIQGSKGERETLARELRQLTEDMGRLRQELAQKSSQALEDFKHLWSERQAEQSRQLEATELAITQAVQNFVKEDKTLQAVLQATREKLQKSLDEERKEREKVFTDMDRQIKGFQTQTRLFERTDELKQQLGEAMDSLKADLGRIEARRAEMTELETQYTRIKRQEDELSQKLARFFAEKRRVDTMEEDFKRLLGLSQSVDQKLLAVTTSNDQLVQIQADVRRLMEASLEANDKFERVEKKSAILDATADAIDKNFQAISDLERNIRTMDADVRELPEQIIQLKRSIEEVSTIQPQVQASLERMDEMTRLMAEAEKRAGELQKAREWLARAETRFEELNKKTNEHLRLLNDILKEDPARGKDRSGAPPLSVQESVRKLAHQGWKTEEIARAVKLSRGEVELILELGGDNK